MVGACARSHLRVAELTVAAPTPCPYASVCQQTGRVVEAARKVDDALSTSERWQSLWNRRRSHVLAETELTKGAASPQVCVARRRERATMGRTHGDEDNGLTRKVCDGSRLRRVRITVRASQAAVLPTPPGEERHSQHEHGARDAELLAGRMATRAEWRWRGMSVIDTGPVQLL